jgi:hypothetical protein
MLENVGLDGMDWMGICLSYGRMCAILLSCYGCLESELAEEVGGAGGLLVALRCLVPVDCSR